MDKLLKGLELRENIGGLVQPFAFKQSTRKTLSCWLDETAIERLQGCVESAIHVAALQQDEPTVGESREVLKRIKTMAAALSVALENAPSIAAAELHLIGHKTFGDWRKSQTLSNELAALSQAAEASCERLPIQGRRASNSFLVSGIAAVAAPAGITLSDSEHGQFAALCRCVFEAAGIHQDPRGSIRAYIAKRS